MTTSALPRSVTSPSEPQKPISTAKKRHSGGRHASRDGSDAFAAGQVFPPLGSVAVTSTSSGAEEHSKASGRARPAARQVKVFVEASAREQSSGTGAEAAVPSAAFFTLAVPLSESSAAAKAALSSPPCKSSPETTTEIVVFALEMPEKGSEAAASSTTSTCGAERETLAKGLQAPGRLWAWLRSSRSCSPWAEGSAWPRAGQ